MIICLYMCHLNLHLRGPAHPHGCYDLFWLVRHLLNVKLARVIFVTLTYTELVSKHLPVTHPADVNTNLIAD